MIPTSSEPAGQFFKMRALGLLFSLILIGLDQLSKAQIRTFLESVNGQAEILPFFNLVSVWNYGISFGMFKAGSPLGAYLLIGVALVITGFFLVWLLRAKRVFQVIACAFVIGGALGNVIDRAIYGAVFDFLDVHGFGYHWPAFNIADSAVFIGIAMIVADGLFLSRDQGESS